MGNIKAEEAMRELTLMLLYLSRFTQREKFHEATDFYAWKGYDFDILNELDDADYIRQEIIRPFQIGIYYGKRYGTGKRAFIQIWYQ